MLIAIALIIPWIFLPLLVEFDYRVFNKFVSFKSTRKDYIIASIMECAMFSGGILVGVALS